MREQEILQPSSGPEEPSGLIRLQVALDKSGRLTPVRYDVVADIVYMDVNGEHPDGFSTQETLKINARSTDPYCKRIWELTAPQRKFHKERYEADMRDMTGIPKEIQRDVIAAERGGDREEVITESVPVDEQRQPGQVFNAEGEPVTRPQTPEAGVLSEEQVQQMQPGQQPIPIPVPTFSQEIMMLNNLVSDGRSAIEDLGQLFELYVEDEKIKAFGANVVKRIQRKYYEYGISEFNPDADGASREEPAAD